MISADVRVYETTWFRTIVTEREDTVYIIIDVWLDELNTLKLKCALRDSGERVLSLLQKLLCTDRL